MNKTAVQARGELLVALSNRIVAIYKELYGKGPVKVRCWYLDDVVLCVLREPLTRSEQTFVEIGHGDRVALQRDSFHQVAGPVFMEAVEELTGRRVDTVLDATDEQKNVSTLVFLLESPEMAALRATDEGGARERQQVRKKARDVKEQARRLRDTHRELVRSFEEQSPKEP
jgi:uncharacterized protein YbcI